MRKNLLLSIVLIAYLCCVPLSVNAQLEVNSLGNVSIGKALDVNDSIHVGSSLSVSDNFSVNKYFTRIKWNINVGHNVIAEKYLISHGNLTVRNHATIGGAIDNNIRLNIVGESAQAEPLYGIVSHIKTRNTMPTGPIFGIYGFADGNLAQSTYPLRQIVGVCGKAYKPSTNGNAFSAGVAGVSNYYASVGVYGAISGDLAVPTSWSENGPYAGYFSGTVKVIGTLFATNISTTSDLSQKENIRQIPLTLAEKIRMLNPVSYTLIQDSVWKYDIEAKELQGTHYGLIAQDVQKIFPELVYERSEKLSINYIELIPLLIKTIQELSAEVETLKNTSIKKSAPYNQNISSSEPIQAILYQNSPNPFSTDTKICYQLPQSTHDATLYIYNMNGLQVDEYPIFSFGEGAVVVLAGALNAGMYLYSLVADGQVVDTKRMILTK